MSNGIRRRRSIFSGLLLVVIGVLFLYHNFQGGFEIWRVIERWWPVVLILWGLAKLYDYWAAKQSGEAPPRTMTGGEILLVIFLFILAGVAGGREWVIKHGPDYDIEVPWATKYTFSEEVPAKAVKANAEIRVNTDRGDITVIPEEIAEVKVSVKKTARGTDESEARKRAETVRVVVVEVDGGYEIRPEVDSNNQRWVRVDLKVKVPTQASVKAKAECGDVKVSGVRGSVKVQDLDGSVEVSDVSSDVTIEKRDDACAGNMKMRRDDMTIRNVGGNIAISGRGDRIEIADVAGQAVINGEYGGPISVSNVAKGARFLSKRTDLTISQLNGRFETGSGRLEITDAPGSVQLETSSFDIVLEKVNGRVRVKNRNGNIEMRLTQAPKEDIELVTERGSIELSVPAKSSFELTAEARRGDIEVDGEFAGIPKTEPDRSGDSRVVAKVGQRGPQISLRTSYGSIQLRKSD